MHSTRLRRTRVIAATLAASALALTGCTAGGGSTNGGNSKTITVAYGSDYVFDTPAQGKKWWQEVTTAFQKANPGVTVKLVPIPGGFNDIVTKLSLLYRSPATAPDVAQLPTEDMSLWASSGYLAPLNDRVKTADWWSRFPASIKAETTLDGTVYGVSNGDNTNGLYYNIPMFKKAGIPTPWQPNTWADVLSAAAKIRDLKNGAWPLWLIGGNAGGTSALQFSGGNLLVGGTTASIYDKTSKKWIVDSPGLREALQFYSDAAKQGLQAPASALLNPNAVVNSIASMAQKKIGIAVTGNFAGPTWTKPVCAPCFPDGPKTYGVAALPTAAGGGVASVLGGWSMSIGAKSGNPDLAWKFIDAAQSEKNLVAAANGAGWVPPDSAAWTNPTYVNFAPPYQSFFAKVMPESTSFPNDPNFPVWAAGFGNATSEIIQNPNTSVDAAIKTLSDYVTGQLGASAVTTLK